MLSSEIVFNSEKIFAGKYKSGEKPCGYLYQHTYYQSYDHTHIMSHGNSKGIDKAIYLNLLPRCQRWTIREKNTCLTLSIPFNKIAILLKAGIAREIDTHTGFGLQIMVPLDEFNDKIPAVQERLM